MNNAQLNEYRRLRRGGFDVSQSPTFAFNGGSESIKHAFGKLVAAHVGLNEGWRVDCEVEMPKGEIDVLWFGPEKLNLAIELETDPDDEIIQSKRTRYVDGNELIDDIHIIPVNNLPANVYDMRDRVRSELNLY